MFIKASLFLIGLLSLSSTVTAFSEPVATVKAKPNPGAILKRQGMSGTCAADGSGCNFPTLGGRTLPCNDGSVSIFHLHLA